MTTGKITFSFYMVIMKKVYYYYYYYLMLINSTLRLWFLGLSQKNNNSRSKNTSFNALILMHGDIQPPSH